MKELIFVYDRTQDDVDKVKELNLKYLSGTITEEEKEEWSRPHKGALNLSDMNRIEGNISVLSEYLSIPLTTKSWSMGDIPRAGDYLRIRNNIDMLRGAWFVLSDTPNTPTQPLNTYQKWNDIERILHDLNHTYQKYINSFYYCDTEVFAGEGVGIL